ncbi:MAG: sodium-dependent bicarbonate transport family permease [Terrimicrobiaceae bacterium]
MDIWNSLLMSLLTPMVLAFLLGVIASLIKSDLKVPPELYTAMTIYLLFAIGLKGGAKLDGVTFGEFWRPLVAAVFLSLAIPVWCYYLMKRFGRLDSVNSAALAAHYGSVSAVTFGEALAFLQYAGVSYEPYVAALLAVMEVPAIILAIFLVGKNTITAGGGNMKKVLRELLTSKSIVLLIGGMAIGILAGKQGAEQVSPLFEDPFRGVLTLFLLEIGLVTGRRLGDLRKAGWRLVAFGIVMPLLHGILGVLLGQWSGMGTGGATILGTLAASASYIAAPAAVRVALPQASPAIYLTASLAVTFPFNVVLGIPIYYSFARWLIPAG